MDEWTDRQVYGRRDKWVDRYMDGWIDREVKQAGRWMMMNLQAN